MKELEIEIQIDNDIPLPRAAKGLTYFKILSQLKSGQSFLFPTCDYSTIRAELSKIQAENAKRIYITKTANRTERRVWRLE